MKHAFVLLLGLSVASCQTGDAPSDGDGSGEAAASTPEMSASTEGLIRAREGEPVVMFLTYVKSDRRPQFEEFVDLINDAMDEISANDSDFAQAAGGFRALNPAAQNEDGTYTYVFMGDPLLEGAETRLRPILSRVYTDEEVDEHMTKWTDSIARPQDRYDFVQSKW